MFIKVSPCSGFNLNAKNLKLPLFGDIFFNHNKDNIGEHESVPCNFSGAGGHQSCPPLLLRGTLLDCSYQLPGELGSVATLPSSCHFQATLETSLQEHSSPASEAEPGDFEAVS